MGSQAAIRDAAGRKGGYGNRLMIGSGGLFLLLAVMSAAVPAPAQMEGKTCTAFGCHADLRVKAVVHEPVARGMCNPCHVQSQPNTHEFHLSFPKETLCQACHILTLKNHVHQPVQDGRCLDCHDPHQSEFHRLLRVDPSKQLCLQCHADDPFMKKQHLHGPVGMGACILCHDSHSSWKPKLLVAQGNDLCALCHKDKMRPDREARHLHPPISRPSIAQGKRDREVRPRVRVPLRRAGRSGILPA